MVAEVRGKFGLSMALTQKVRPVWHIACYVGIPGCACAAYTDSSRYNCSSIHPSFHAYASIHFQQSRHISRQSVHPWGCVSERVSEIKESRHTGCVLLSTVVANLVINE